MNLRKFLMGLGFGVWGLSASWAVWTLSSKAFALDIAAPAREMRLPVPEIETLPNGLQLVWFVSDHLPVVDLALMVKSGFRDDPVGKSGTAEFLAASLDRGSAGMSAQAIAHAIEKLGASRYSSAEADSFSIGMHGLAQDGETLLDLLAKIVVHPDFPESEVQREHARILDRWSHLGDYGESLVTLGFHRLLAAGTSYGRGNLVGSKEFNRVTREDMLRFYRAHFTPKNSLLMVVGRVDRPEFRKKILQAFGAWQGEAPKRDWRKFTDQRLAKKKGELLLIDRPGLTQAQVRIGFPAPLLKAPEHYALVVANALLGEYFNSRLVSLIRDQLALTYSISSAFSYSQDFDGFVIGSSTRNEMTGQLIQNTIEVLRKLKAGPIPEEEVRMAKEYLEGGFPLSTATLGAVASRWLAGYVFDLGPNYLNEFFPKVAAIRAEDVLAAVKKDFDLSKLEIVIAGDASKIEPSLRAVKLDKYKKVKIPDLM